MQAQSERQRIVNACGSHLLHQIPEGKAVCVYDISTDNMFWVALLGRGTGMVRLECWEATEEDIGSAEKSEFGYLRSIPEEEI